MSARLRLTYLVLGVDSMGGTERTVVNQAASLADRFDVRILSVLRQADRPHAAIDPRVRVDYLVDLRDPARPSLVTGVTPADAAALAGRPSLLVPARWDGQFDALSDVAMEQVLPGLDADVVVTVTPGLLAAALRLLPSRTVVVHQEHRASAQRTGGREPLLAHAAQADLVAVLTQDSADWLRAELAGGPVPELVVVPNPLPPTFSPRSELSDDVILSGGRFTGEKQFVKLLDAFALIADDLPTWRLRLIGDGPLRNQLVRQIRRHDLWDRVELPGAVTDVAAEWARASIGALTSRHEALPLTLQEAMAAGVPCASFDTCTGPRDLITHEVDGLLVTQESVVGMATALHRLATDADLRARLGAAALISVRERYAARSIADVWAGLLTDAVARRAGRGRLAALATRQLPIPATDPASDPANDPADDPAPDATRLREVTPAQARTALLRLAVDCARAVTDRWLVVPPHETGVPVLVLPMPARDAFLAALAAAEVPAYASLRDPARGGWPERRGTPAVLGTDLRRGRTPLLALEPWPTAGATTSPLAHGCTVEVEAWEVGLDGQLVSPRLNRYTQRLPADFQVTDCVEVEVDGVTVRTATLMAEPTVHEVRFPIDAVLTWVDGADPAWDAARRQRLDALAGTGRTREASGQARYVSRDELRYALRSLHLYAPWLRTIHLVTAGQAPAWLDTALPGVRLVDHRDLLPAAALPTFNSHAIETALHRVPGLAEHFLYLNDDFLLARPVRPETFFSPAGATAVVTTPSPLGLTDAADAAPYVRAAWNNRRLLQESFGAVVTHHLAHAPYAHRVSVLAEIEARYAEAVAATAHAPFRSETDVSLLSSLAQHYGLLTGTAYVADVPHAYVNLAGPDVERQLARVRAREHDVVCLADHHDHALDAARLDALVGDFLEDFLPVRAPWERPTPSRPSRAQGGVDALLPSSGRDEDNA